MSKEALKGWGQPPRKRTDIPPSSSPSPDDDPAYWIAPRYSATYQANTGKLVMYGSIAAVVGLGVLGVGHALYKAIK